MSTPERPRAARFDDVDAAGAAEQIAYLDRQSASQFWRGLKAESIGLLGLSPGQRALDVGCGVGDEVRAMAAVCGSAVGVDASRRLVKEAVARTSVDLDATFVVGDAGELPFEPAAFDGVRIERVLQHVADPALVVAEMARVARPGAPVVAVEPDWDTMSIDGEPFEVTMAVCRRWADSIRQPRVGRSLPELLSGAGLERVSARVVTSIVSSLSFADDQYALLELAAASAEELGAGEVERWIADLRERDASGRFVASVTYVVARGYATGR